MGEKLSTYTGHTAFRLKSQFDIHFFSLQNVPGMLIFTSYRSSETIGPILKLIPAD
jgi:hypothetical protein